jgi:hypothetical protein
MVLLGMTPPNLAHVRPAEPCTSSLGAPDRDTDESQQACTSSNALFGAQPADLHFDLVEADDSPEPFSVFLPDFLTEYVSYLFMIRHVICAAIANRAFHSGPIGRLTVPPLHKVLHMNTRPNGKSRRTPIATTTFLEYPAIPRQNLHWLRILPIAVHQKMSVHTRH